MLCIDKTGHGVLRAPFGTFAELYTTSDFGASWTLLPDSEVHVFGSDLGRQVPYDLQFLEVARAHETGWWIMSTSQGVVSTASNCVESWGDFSPIAGISAIEILSDDIALVGCVDGTLQLTINEGFNWRAFPPDCDCRVLSIVRLSNTEALVLRMRYELGVSITQEQQQREAYAIWEEMGRTGAAVDHWTAARRRVSYKRPELCLIRLAPGEFLQNALPLPSEPEATLIHTLTASADTLCLGGGSSAWLYKLEGFSELIQPIVWSFIKKPDIWGVVLPVAGDILLCLGSGDAPLISDDRGRTWRSPNSLCGANGAGGRPEDCCFIDDTHGFALGGNYGATFTVCETTDSGRSWRAKFVKK
jgi:hypothetical protein